MEIPKLQKITRGYEKKSSDGVAGSTLGGSCPKCGKQYALVGRIHNCVPSDSVVIAAASSVSTSSPERESFGSPVLPAASGEKFDRNSYQKRYMKTYMKEYMRKRRKHDREKEGRPGG